MELFGIHNWAKPRDNIEAIPIRVQRGDMEILYMSEGYSNNVSTRSGFLDDLRDIGVFGWREKAGFLLPSYFDSHADPKKEITHMSLITAPRFGIENRFRPLQKSSLHSLGEAFWFSNRHKRQYFPFIRNNMQEPKELMLCQKVHFSNIMLSTNVNYIIHLLHSWRYIKDWFKTVV